MFKHITLVSVTALTALTVGSLPLYAQTPSTTEGTTTEGTTTESTTTTTERQVDTTVLLDLNRAKNLARQAAERANGGLGYYRSELAMHGPASQAPHVDNGNGSWTFTFKGRRPTSDDYTIESVVTVHTDGRVNVDYNGAVRSATP
jgi:hypothetical protein